MNPTIEREQTKTITFCAPCSGTFCRLESLSDPVFREKVLGDGFAVEPEDPFDGDIVSPVDGIVTHVQNTGHALSLEADGGCEVLLHMGIDTVSMDGDGFHVYVRPGTRVHKGERLLHADLQLIRRRGCGTACVVIVTDGSAGKAFALRAEENTPVRAGRTPVLQITG